MEDNKLYKAILKRTADVLEKLAIAGIAMAIFQFQMHGAVFAIVFLSLSYLFTIWEVYL